MHPEWESIARAVVAKPDDDLPRLIAADWLDEHGEPERAELIRIQLRLASGEADPSDTRRERELLTAHGARWCRRNPDDKIIVVDCARSPTIAILWQPVGGAARAEAFTFRRGFIEKIAPHYAIHPHHLAPSVAP